MGLTVYWTRFAENKLDDVYKYYKKKQVSKLHKI